MIRESDVSPSPGFNVSNLCLTQNLNTENTFVFPSLTDSSLQVVPNFQN